MARALERDAPVIGRALVLQQMTLQAATSEIRTNLAQSAQFFYVDRVERPYKQGTSIAAGSTTTASMSRPRHSGAIPKRSRRLKPLRSRYRWYGAAF